MKSRPDPTRLLLAARFEELSENHAGWTYQMWAQFYDVVNDRGWVFFSGSFRKTIAERVDRGRVKVHDGHNHEMNATGTIGRVLAAEEVSRGCRYTGFLTRSEEATAQKMADGTLDENSVEVSIMKAEKIERPLDDVPERVRPWVQITTDGLAVLTGITEVMWHDVGIVSKSSQDRPATIQVPVAVAYQDLPVSLSRWDPDGARDRVREWSAGGIARLSRAHLVSMPGGDCFGQVADVEDGELVVVLAALDDAYGVAAQALSGRLGDSEHGLTMASVAHHIGRYDEKKSLTACAASGTHDATPAALATGTALQGGAEPPPDTPETEPNGTSTPSDVGRLERLREVARLQQLRKRARDGVYDPTGTSGQPATRRSPE